jgi:hypothetical protein
VSEDNLSTLGTKVYSEFFPIQAILGHMKWLGQLFGSPPKKKRTSRPQPKGRATVGRGTLSYKTLKAKRYTGQAPQLKGRIQVRRGTGLTEYPDRTQFDRIAREEGIRGEDVDRAFGPLPGKPKRTSRDPGSAKGTRRVSRNARYKQRTVRRGFVFAPETRDGDPIDMVARVTSVRDPERFGAAQGVQVDIQGQVQVLTPIEAARAMSPWISKQEFDAAFGHLQHKSVLGPKPQQRPLPRTHQARSMRIGHRMPPGEGPPQPGIVQGQLVLFHRPSGSIVWEMYEDSITNPDKPFLIRHGNHEGHFGFAKAMQGGQVGHGKSRIQVGVIDMGIKPMTMLRAFHDFLRREGYPIDQMYAEAAKHGS